MGNLTQAKLDKQILETLGPKVTLVARVKVEGKWRRFPVLYTEKGKGRPGMVLINGTERSFAGCSYELLYYVKGQKKYKAVGKDAIDAETERIVFASRLTAEGLIEDAGFVVLDPVTDRVTLKKSAEEYIKRCQRERFYVSATDAKFVSDDFIKTTKLTYIDEVTQDAILDYLEDYRKRGRADESAVCRYSRLRAWFRFAKVDPEVIPPVPRVTEKLPVVYTAAEMVALFKVADPYESIGFGMLQRLGLREHELVFAEFSDISEARRVFRVAKKDQFGHRIKNRKERAIPIPDDLFDEMMAWKALHPGQSLILTAKDGGPDHNLLIRLKAVAARAGLACGRCAGCRRSSGCSEFTLKKWRSTCITAWLLARLDLRTVQGYAGHADLRTTAKYLRPLSADAGQAIVSAIDWATLKLGF